VHGRNPDGRWHQLIHIFAYISGEVERKRGGRKRRRNLGKPVIAAVQWFCPAAAEKKEGVHHHIRSVHC